MFKVYIFIISLLLFQSVFSQVHCSIQKKEQSLANNFIQKNSAYHFTVEGNVLAKYTSFFNYLDSLNRLHIPTREPNSQKVTSAVDRQWKRANFYITQTDWNTLNKANDAQTISSDFINRNTSEAVITWNRCQWSKHYSSQEFCEYVLPYRVFSEKPENWREYFHERYARLSALPQFAHDPILLADSINKDIESWFSFSTLFYQFPFDMNFSQILKSRMGNCNHMVTATIYAFRSVGIPCAVDFCPQYGNRKQGHVWVAILDTNKNTVPVNGASTRWLEMGYVFHKQALNVKMPKVLRQTFAPQANSLMTIKKVTDTIPSQFGEACVMDVSAKYMSTSDVKLAVPQLALKQKFAYLCVFDNAQWIPVWWGKIENNMVLFKDMGRDIVYLPIVLDKGRLTPIGNPFLLTKKGEIEEIKKQLGRAQALKLFSKYPMELTAENDSTNGILQNNVYELFYWNTNHWQSLGKKQLSDRKRDIDSLGFDFKKTLFFKDCENKSFLFYENNPVGVLFLLRNLTQGKEERIFTVEDDKQIWW